MSALPPRVNTLGSACLKTHQMGSQYGDATGFGLRPGSSQRSARPCHLAGVRALGAMLPYPQSLTLLGHYEQNACLKFPICDKKKKMPRWAVLRLWGSARATVPCQPSGGSVVERRQHRLWNKTTHPALPLSKYVTCQSEIYYETRFQAVLLNQLTSPSPVLLLGS